MTLRVPRPSKPMADTPYAPELSRAIDDAVARVCNTIRQSMPLSAERVIEWMKQLAGGAAPEFYFHHVRGSPMFLFPWYLERTLNIASNNTLQRDLVYSTVNGYYWIRLIDNLMDGQATNEIELLPALSVFHTEFQSTYAKRFSATHPFWKFFATTWFHSADVTIQDSSSLDMNRQQFVHVAAQKICAIKIPLTAICYSYATPDLLDAWTDFVDIFGCWHQMANDLFHWYEDNAIGTPSYFLAEAQRQKTANESIAEWVTRAGLQWGLSLLAEWMNELQARAVDLHSSELLGYLRFRDELLQREGQEMMEALQLAANAPALFF